MGVSRVREGGLVFIVAAGTDRERVRSGPEGGHEPTQRERISFHSQSLAGFSGDSLEQLLVPAIILSSSVKFQAIAAPDGHFGVRGIHMDGGNGTDHASRPVD